jgi:hypothetical protein
VYDNLVLPRSGARAFLEDLLREFMSAKRIVQQAFHKYDALSVSQVASGPDWDSFIPLERHEKIIAYRDLIRGDVHIRYQVEQLHRR